MRARHVIGNRRMAAPVGCTGMARDPLTLVEDLDRLVGDAHIDEFTDEPIRGGIPMAVDLDVIVGRDAATLPARKDVWLVRQLCQLELVDLGKEFGTAGAETAHLAGVEFDDKHANGGIEFRQGKEAVIAQTRQDPALRDLDGDLNLRLVLWASRPRREDGGAVMARHLGVGSVETGIVALPGAANNRRKYLSTMLGWAVEEGLIKSNPSRDVKKIKNVTSGFHQWTVEEVRAFEAHHAIGTMPRLALALMLYLGVRRGDAVRLGHANVTDGWIKFVPAKTDYMRKTVSEKPILPVLARIIAATATGTKTFLVTSHGKPFAAKGFGNWFRDRCDEAGLLGCTAHGLRKAGAAICAEEGASDRQLMALFDWTSSAQATTYTRGADKRTLAAEAARMLEQGMNRGTGSDREQEVSR